MHPWSHANGAWRPRGNTGTASIVCTLTTRFPPSEWECTMVLQLEMNASSTEISGVLAHPLRLSLKTFKAQ